jgi:ferrochelatase
VSAYPTEGGFITALAGLVDKGLAEAAAQKTPVRLLLSAHGLPLKIVRKGDPYPQQVESTAAALGAALEQPITDWRVCYQSRVGPLAWLRPSVEEELRAAGQDGVAVVIAPISFVSEHSETLVELDRDYRRLAESCGVPFYYRVPTVSTEPEFIAGLARLVREETPAAVEKPASAAAPAT